MSNIHTSIDSLIGRTPLLELRGVMAAHGLSARVLAKLECRNPGGSAKDRVALYMLNDAEEKGLIGPGATIIEPTSGNTGIGLACVAASRGYKAIIVMPDTMSVERQKLMKAYGAEVVLTPGKLGMQGAIDHAKALQEATANSFVPGQFDNPANPQAHYLTTGPEIWADTDGKLDAFVAGVGTGGTITGVGRFLKAQDPGIRVIAAEPADSPLLSRGIAGSHGIQGIGANFVPSVLDTGIYDRVIPICLEDAYAAARLAGRADGILAGISSGAALHAAITLAKEETMANKTIVVLLPDTGERYLSTALFQD